MLSPYVLIQLVCIALFIYGIRLMNSPKTAVRGNLLGAVGMAGAIITTMLEAKVLSAGLVWAGILVGTALGTWLALAVKMIQMPQMVALFNGFGGAASFLVAALTALEGGLNTFTLFTSGLAIVVGGITFCGCVVAAAKLHGVMHQRPVHLKGHNNYLYVSGLIMVLSTLGLTFQVGAPAVHIALLIVFSHVFGYVFTIRVGGADKPITISLLNSFSGVAGSVAGFALPNGALLVVVGSIVGASGLILTQIMCRAMNRSLMDILLGKTTVLPGKGEPKPDPTPAPAPEPEPAQPAGPSWQEALRDAEKVAIIPGYGMALAQAQLQVKQLGELLESQGKEVRYGIHPVAGRMPGHMNVLLAEVDVPYEQLCELDEINAFLEEADLAVIVGANDVVNPAAMELEGTPIYGMPIIRADKARCVLVCNYDTKPGYAGVDNSLYQMEQVHLLLGDAKDSLAQLLEAAKGEAAEVIPLPEKETPGQDPVALLEAAQRVVIVPGYGMALAQAQGQVKDLVELLQSRGKRVEIAVHPVAGRMPGHMNVLMAEVDIPYELLMEMEQINDQLQDEDVAVVEGANDVINPAANTHEGTPIYGMPVLNVAEARRVIIYNLDRSPGYAGVENTLYDMEHCIFVPGDAAVTLQALLQALRLAS